MYHGLVGLVFDESNCFETEVHVDCMTCTAYIPLILCFIAGYPEVKWQMDK